MDEIDQSLACTTGEEMTQVTNRPTTEIEWRDAREEEPDGGQNILAIKKSGEILSVYVHRHDAQQIEYFINGSGAQAEWPEITFWAPTPTDLPTKDWTLEVLNRQLPGWETCEEGGYEWGTEIGDYYVRISAMPVDNCGIVEFRSGSTKIRAEKHMTHVTTSMDCALGAVLRMITRERDRLDEITKQIDV